MWPKMILKLSTLCCAVLFSGTSTIYGVSTYHLQSLGTLDGEYSIAYAINNQREVVGWSTTPSNECHAFVWQASTGMTDLNVPAQIYQVDGGHSTSLLINKLGNIAGNSESPDGYQNGQAFTWTPQDGARKLNVDTLWLTGFNDSNVAVGYTNTNAGYRAFKVDANNNVQPITVPGLNIEQAMQINNQGKILLQARNADNLEQSYILNPDGSTTLISREPNWLITGLLMNDKGTVAGVMENLDSGYHHAFVWNATDGIRELNIGDLDWGVPFALNNQDQMLGGEMSLSTGQQIWTLLENGQAYDLTTLIDSSGDGWSSFKFNGINDNGDIVGSGAYQGRGYAILLTPNAIAVPEPASLTLLGMGLLLLHRRRG